MKRKKLWFIAGGVGLLIVVSIAATRNNEKGEGVQAVQVKRERLVSKVSANGTIQAVTKADISANVMGQVTRLKVIHRELVIGGSFLKAVEPGWPMILSSLKSLIETGSPLEFHIVPEMRYEVNR